MSASGVSVDPEKVEAVMSWERSKSDFEIRSFLGLTGYYRRFIEDFSRIAAPMTRLTWKEVKCFVLISVPNSIPKRRNYGCLAL